MKFDYIVGNPPYQEEKDDNGRKPPIYHLFMDEAYKLSNKVELITPARFLFNAGQTPKVWNKKMLDDPHVKVLYYEQDSSNVFTNTDIKGGIAITYRDTTKNFGAIKAFAEHQEMDTILKKVVPLTTKTIEDITVGAVPYGFAEKFREDMPDSAILAGKSFDLRTNVFDNLYNQIFFSEKPDDGYRYIKFWGLLHKRRVCLWAKDEYIIKPENFRYWKVILPEANNSGNFGEVLASPFTAEPYVGHTQTFISIGAFQSRNEAENTLKYLKTKFSRSLLGILKVTQHNPKSVWHYIPVQDFTSSSDIDWSQSISDIDRQLYAKYGLDDSEIEFIETHVKEMT